MTQDSLTRSLSRWVVPAGVAAGVILVVSVVLVLIEGSVSRTEQTTQVSWHPQVREPTVVDGASASLVRTDDGIEFEFDTAGLTPGNAYTLWLAVVDEPSGCSTSPCPPPEILGLDEADGQVLFADGLVVGVSGEATFTGEQPVGAIPGWLPNRIFDDPIGAEVVLVVNDHGPELPEHMPGMISTYRGGCSEGSPFPEFFPSTALSDGEPGPNTCLLTQVATFAP